MFKENETLISAESCRGLWSLFIRYDIYPLIQVNVKLYTSRRNAIFCHWAQAVYPSLMVKQSLPGKLLNVYQ